jgi:hypothetical protein
MKCTDSTLIRPLSVVCFVVVGFSLSATAQSAQGHHDIQLDVIYASAHEQHIDPKLQEVATQLQKLPYTSYRLKDRISLKLKVKAKSRLQLPSKHWLRIEAVEITQDRQRLRLKIEFNYKKFKTTVAIAKGARVILRGPPYEQGTLILAVRRKP